MSSILREDAEAVAVVSINRPAQMNALDAATNLELRAVLRGADGDDAVAAVVLTGVGGRAFCAGADVRDRAVMNPRQTRRVSFGGGLTGVAGRLERLTKPLVAAVVGHAIGGGCELAMACDVVVAGRSASFWIPEAQRGYIAESPVGHRALRHLPYHIAMEFVLSGRLMGAEEAHRWGLANAVVDDELAVPTAIETARRIGAGNRQAISAYKHAMESRYGWPLDVALSTRFEPIEEFQASRFSD